MTGLIYKGTKALFVLSKVQICSFEQLTPFIPPHVLSVRRIVVKRPLHGEGVL